MHECQFPDPERTRYLLQRASAGDTSAEWKLYSSFGKVVEGEAQKHRLMRILAGFETPENVVGEVWLQCFESDGVRRFHDRGKGSFRKYLCKILNRVMVDLVRYHKAEKRGCASRIEMRSDSVDSLKNVISNDPTPTSAARLQEYDDLTREMLNNQELAVWQMKNHEGLNSVEIGERLNLSDSRVRGIYMQAKKKILLSVKTKIE